MKKERNELLEFLAGLAMLVVGLYLLMTNVHVSSGFWGGFMLGRMPVSSGMVVIPFIIGIVWIFANPDSFIAKLIAGLGLLLIIASIIVSTRIWMTGISLFEWILMLVLIFGGLGLLCRILFKNPKKSKKDRKQDEEG